MGRTLCGCANRNATKDGAEVKGYRSHPSRVRESKPRAGFDAEGRCPSRPARVCESKRTDLHTGKDAPGRTLHGCVSQNSLRITLVIVMTVAPFAGARIEILTLPYNRVRPIRRTSRGCVNRNCGAYNRTIRRTLRGCANRTVQSFADVNAYYMPPLYAACELNNSPPHSRDFSRELGGVFCKNSSHMV